MKLKLALAGSLLAVGLAVPASAHPFPGPGPGAWNWDFLGQRVVRHFAENDAIPAYGHRHYRQIKLCAYQRPVRLYDLDVRFQNGGHQDVAVRAVLNPGQCTRAIDLNGFQRDIKFVHMAYETLGWHHGPRAFVRLYAR